MQFLIMFFIITIISIMFSIKLRIKTEQAVPITVLGLTVLVYLTGIIGNLLVGIYLIIFMFIMSIFFVIYYFLKYKEKKKIFLKQYITPGIIIYGGIYIFFILLNKGRVFNNYDEFNHWALIIKDMYLNNNFSFEREAITAFNEYPPFTAVFEYIMLKFSSSYSEDTIIIANNILTISIMLPIFKKLSWNRNIKWIIIILPITLLVPLIIYTNYYFDILVDGLIGILIAYVVYQWFTNSNNKFYRNISVGLGMIALSLIKSSGIGIVIILTIIIVIECIKNKFSNNSIKKNDIISIVTIFLISVFLLNLWTINIEKNNKQKKWNLENITLENIIEVFRKNEIIDRKELICDYIKRIIYNGTITERKLTVFTSTLFIVIINFFVYNSLKEKNKRRYLYYSIGLYIFEVIYLSYMLLVYLFLLNPDEATGFASFDRYYGSIFLGMLLFHLWTGIEYIRKVDVKKFIIIWSIIIMFIPFDIIQTKIINSKQDKINSIINRKEFVGILEYKNVLTTNDKVYYVETESSNFQYSLQIMKYQMLPIIIDNKDVSLNVEEIKEVWKENNYTYVYIQKVNDLIKKEFEQKFFVKIEDKSMYKIKIEEEIIKLEKVE